VFGQTAKWYLQFDHIASNKGLSAPTNHFVYRDSKGFTWISSIEGLNRYDGRHIKVYKSSNIDSLSLIDDNIQSPFFEDNQGDIWFTTVNGINCYRRKRDNFERFTVKDEGNVSNFIGYIAVFYEQNRWLWTEVGGKLYRFDTQGTPQYKTEILHDLQAVRFAIDTFPNGKVKTLIGCYWNTREGIDIIEYNEQTKIIQRQSFFTKLSPNFLPLKIRQILIENDTLVWLSAGDFLVKFNPKKPSNFKLYKPSPIGTTIRNISLSNNNELWVSTNQSSPLLLFDKKIERFNNQLIHYSSFSKSLTDATKIYHDKKENLWVSTTQNGIFNALLKHQQINNPLQNRNQSSLSIGQIIEDKNGNIWINHLGKRKQAGYYIFGKNK
jgi:ligand-binding sensor domain-containing protein